MIRPVNTDDLDAVNEIYNQAVYSGFQTAHTEAVSLEDRYLWFQKYDLKRYPVYAYAELGVITGWISLSPYREGRNALRYTAEVSFYVHRGHRRQGTGSKLLEYVIGLAPGLGIKTLIAILLEPNKASISLLKKYGFRKWGDMPDVADFDGRECNHQYYGLRIIK